MRGTGSRKLLLALAMLIIAASIAGLGTLASGYSSSGASGISVTTGTVTIAAGTANRLTTDVLELEPGDTLRRPIDLVSSTTLLSSMTLTTTDTFSGAKLSVATDGLQMTVQWCSTAGGWTEAGTAPAFTYTCSGTTTTLIGPRDVIGSAMSLGSALNAENSGATLPTTDHLLITLTLPATSPSSAQSAQSIINYAFTGVQLTPPKKAR